MKVKAVIGAGYGDEGKGLMTDYFCNQYTNSKVLNIRVNGGAQAGHTVCKFDSNNKSYKHWVFRSLGSGTFSNADTYLASHFLLNIEQLYNELHMIKEIYNIEPMVYIDKRCRVTLPCDVFMNRSIEQHRLGNKHGSCGLGIYETVHRNKELCYISINDIKQLIINKDINKFSKVLLDRCGEYINYRVKEIKRLEGIEVGELEQQKILTEIQTEVDKLLNITIELLTSNSIKLVDNIDSILTDGEYKGVAFESSQGLELDQYNTRNYPHLTPSSTGLLNVIDCIKESKALQKCELEVCFVTRSYKTKHGAGKFLEESPEIKNEFALYDRTNAPNEFQGTLKFGRLHIGRMKRLIFDQVDLLSGVNINAKKLKVSLSITHLDQTNECLLTQNEYIHYKDLDYKAFNKVYTSFGEKCTDVVVYKSSTK